MKHFFVKYLIWHSKQNYDKKVDELDLNDHHELEIKYLVISSLLASYLVSFLSCPIDHIKIRM